MPDYGALRELMRQSERLLDAQDAAVNAGLQRAGDMLRLTVATLGGMIVIGGILSAAEVVTDVWGQSSFALGIFMLIWGAVILARVLAGGGGLDAQPLAFGPDIGDAVALVDEPDFTEEALLRATLEAVPSWLEDNRALIRAIERRRGRALSILIAGVVIILGGLLYMIGGAILV